MPKPKPRRNKNNRTPSEPSRRGRPQDVMEIPELLALIVQASDSKQQRKLMRVSKYFFHSAGPVVWKRVPRLDSIMRLIKGVQVEVKELYIPVSDESSENISFVTIKFPLSPDLSRYNVYAHWVQELEICAGCSQETKNLRSFRTLLDGRAPLPNLRRLTACTIAPIDEKDLMRFFNFFMNPSLTEIRTIIPQKGLPHPWSSRVPSSSIPLFLESIKKTCPKIQVLEFYPESTHRSTWSESYTETQRILPSFVNLRSFSSSTYILEPAIFSILGELPYLESLGIRGLFGEPSVLDQQLSIPKTWFSALKDLRLYEVHHQDIQTLWKQPTIVKNLVSAQIQTSPPRHKNQWPGVTLLAFLEALPHLSPHLDNIVFCMGHPGRMIEIPRDHWSRVGTTLFSPH